MGQLFIFFFCPLIFLFFIFRFIKPSSKTKKLPPGPTGLPVIGSLHLLGSQPHKSLYKLAQTHGPLMTLRIGSVTTIIASSPETAKEILHKNDQNFSNRTVPDVILAQPNPEGTLAWVPGDAHWRTRRRICNTKMFNAHTLDSLQHLRHQKIHQLMGHIRKQSLSGTAVDIGQLAFASSLNLISNTIFSIDIIDSDFESAQEFKDVVWRIMEDSGRPNVSDHFPILRRFDLQGVRSTIRAAYLRLHEIFNEIIDRRIKARAVDHKVNRAQDFLDVLLDQCEEKGSGFTLDTMKPLILDLFIAGSDTSALTVEWAMSELIRNPNTLGKAKNEIIEVLGKEAAVKESDVNRLPYLQAIVKETLRLHPAAPLLLPYKAEKEVEVCGYTIPKDSKVLVNAWAIGRDPRYWKDPTSFLPERFLGSNVDFRGQDFELIPFGAGRRLCTGLPLAVRMVHLMLASLIQSFDWKLPEGITPENLDMNEQFGTTLKKAIPLLAVPVLGE